MENDDKKETSPQQKAFPFLVLFLLMMVALLVGAAFVARQMLLLHQNPQIGDVLFLGGGLFLASGIFRQWQRRRCYAPSEPLQQSTASPAEQISQILGYTLLCAANFAPSLLMETTIATSNGQRGNVLLAGAMGMQAVIGLFFFTQERLLLRRRNTPRAA